MNMLLKYINRFFGTGILMLMVITSVIWIVWIIISFF